MKWKKKKKILTVTLYLSPNSFISTNSSCATDISQSESDYIHHLQQLYGPLLNLITLIYAVKQKLQALSKDGASAPLKEREAGTSPSSSSQDI